jgi:hypothetical protein
MVILGVEFDLLPRQRFWLIVCWNLCKIRGAKALDFFCSGGKRSIQAELRALALVASGCTIPETAAALGVKIEVAQAYIYFFYRTLGIRTIPALIEWAKDMGLDDPALAPAGKPYRKNPEMRGFFGVG